MRDAIKNGDLARKDIFDDAVKLCTEKVDQSIQQYK